MTDNYESLQTVKSQALKECLAQISNGKDMHPANTAKIAPRADFVAQSHNLIRGDAVTAQREKDLRTSENPVSPQQSNETKPSSPKKK